MAADSLAKGTSYVDVALLGTATSKKVATTMFGYCKEDIRSC